ncbi:MAG: 30S ribosomal protein S2 [Candidatus Levybacteria bacterium]|nr:30S ribosomal protein S2 [Candidatus Levybacteria bacterium]
MADTKKNKGSQAASVKTTASRGKTVNRTGKKLIEKALVVKAKTVAKVNAENIKKHNEKLIKDKKELERKKIEGETAYVVTSAVKQDKKYDLTIDLKDLLEAGCHLGHKVSKTHPKAKVNIYMAKDGIQIVDLLKTKTALEKACNYIYNARRNGKQIVLLGTKRQAREVVKRVALDAGVGYITDRWLGGTISNWEQIKKNIKKYNDIKDGLSKNKFTDKSKKELGDLAKEQIRLEKMIGGLATTEKMFDILMVVDAGFEKTALKECKMKNVKTVAITDTDSDPRKVDFAIPANDDSVKSINIIIEEIGKAIKAAGTK